MKLIQERNITIRNVALVLAIELAEQKGGIDTETLVKKYQLYKREKALLTLLKNKAEHFLEKQKGEN